MSGYDNGDYTVASGRTSTGVLAWTAWTVSMDYDYDIAAIELRYPIGGAAGWYGYGYNNTDSYFTGNTFISSGFPAESPYDGEIMYTWSGTFDTVETEQLEHDNYSYGGQSGSGVNNTSQTVYGVLSHGNNDPEDPASYTGYTRITSGKFTTLTDWFTANTPTSFDLALYGVNVTPESFDRGDSLSSLIYYVFNLSTISQSSATYKVDFYLSTNDYISTSDTFLQSRYGTWSFSSKSGQRIVSSSNFPTIPGNLCVSGDTGAWYYIGAILDYSDSYATNNASHYYQPARIWINACDDYENDDTSASASTLYGSYDYQTHDIVPADDEDWMKFNLYEESAVDLITSGPWGADTQLYLYNASLEQIEYNDDGGLNAYSYIGRTCGEDPLPVGLYYVKVTSYNQASKIQDYGIELYTDTCEAASDTESFLPLIIR